MLKQLLLLSIVIFSLLNMGFAAETKTQDATPLSNATAGIIIRYSRHEGFNRLVFEAKDEGFVKDTSITQAENRILAQFPSVPKITVQGSLDVETFLKGKSYEINMKNPFKIKVMKLTSPPRISVDIFPQSKETPAKSSATEGVVAGKSSVPKMVLDPGHGGYDLGIIRDNIREKDLTFSVAHEVETAVSKNKKTMSLTRNSDQFMSILDRALLANQRSPDIFISLHISANEVMIIYISLGTAETPEALQNKSPGIIARKQGYAEKVNILSEGLARSFRDEFRTTEVLIRNLPLPLLDSIIVPGVMIEVPISLASDVASRKRLAGAIIKGTSVYETR